MAKGSSFGNFGRDFKKDTDKFKLKPIMGSFGGAAPDSLYASNVQSAWARWRRGMELAVAQYNDAQFEYSFRYVLPPVGGVVFQGTPPSVGGVFVGYPTPNKELGMHWAGSTNAGNLRFDQLQNTSGTATISGEVPKDTLFNGRIQDNQTFWYIQISGNWSDVNPLPPPLYIEVPIPGVPFAPPVIIKPINGFPLADRITVSGGVPVVNRPTFSGDPPQFAAPPFPYTEAVLADVDGHKGILQLKKPGSVGATFGGTFITPSREDPPFVPGRFFMTGSKYCCSCQDFNQREYFYASSIMGMRKGKLFPRSSPATLKPGRYEKVKAQLSGIDINNTRQNVMNAPINDGAQTQYSPALSGIPERDMMIVTPSGSTPEQYRVSGEVNQFVSFPSGNRDFPGVFRDFGRQYLTQYGDNPNSVAPTYPKMMDYDSVSGTNGNPRVITAVEDYWFPTLDEVRRCKHIYAMLYVAKQYGPEPSDYPVEEGSIVQWEQDLVKKTEKDQLKAATNLAYYGLSRMDVPPYNMQSPMMAPMMTKLLNLPSAFINISGMQMFGPDGGMYMPSSGQTPETLPQRRGF